MGLSFASASIMGFAVWYFGDFFLGLYNSDPAVIEAGMVRLFWVTLFLVLNGVLDIFVGSMRGMGHSTLPTLLMIIGICGIRLTWLWTVFPVHHSLEVIYMCFPLSWSITSLILGILWVHCYRQTVRGDPAKA